MFILPLSRERLSLCNFYYSTRGQIIELKDKLILVQNLLPSMHSVCIMHIFHEFLKTPLCVVIFFLLLWIDVNVSLCLVYDFFRFCRGYVHLGKTTAHIHTHTHTHTEGLVPPTVPGSYWRSWKATCSDQERWCLWFWFGGKWAASFHLQQPIRHPRQPVPIASCTQ